MAKTKTVYVCSNCGADSPKWLGKCPNCGEWNTYVEEIVTKEPAVKRPVPGIMEGNKIRPVLLRDITTEEEARIDLKDDELNRVLGGGLVKGSLVLIGGEPQDTIHIMLIALKLQHRIHDMLQYLRTGDTAFLIDMADQ